MADDGPDHGVGDQPPAAARRRAVSPLTGVTIAGAAVVLALGVLCGWLGERVYREHRSSQMQALFLEVGRQGAVNLTTLDHEHADADVQRILDSSTGEFHDDFAGRAKPFAEAVRKGGSTSTGTVTEAGLESVDPDHGVVLVAVTVKTAKAGVPEPEPRYWRMRLTVSRIGETAKVSRVDFVP